MGQRFLNNFETIIAERVKARAETDDPDTELDFGIIRVSDGAAGRLRNPEEGEWYTLTAFKRIGSSERDYEVMRVLSVDNSTVGECRLTVQRAQEGTIAQAFIAGDPVEMRVTAGTLEAFARKTDPQMTDPRPPKGAAGGVLSGQYPNPGFAVPMATAEELAKKVDKVAGKGLSANDFTNLLLQKLTAIAEGATANATDADLRERSKHTGKQAIATVEGLAEALANSVKRESHTGLQPMDTVAGLVAAIALLAAKESPALTGVPTAPTAAADNASTQIANTQYVTSAIAAAVTKLLGGAASEALDTLIELGNALGNDADFAATMTQALAGKVDKVAGMGLSANSLTDALLAKLNGIAAGATANAPDEELRDRSKHTGKQAIETVEGLELALSGKQQAQALQAVEADNSGIVMQHNTTYSIGSSARAVVLPAGAPVGAAIKLVFAVPQQTGFELRNTEQDCALTVLGQRLPRGEGLVFDTANQISEINIHKAAQALWVLSLS